MKVGDIVARTRDLADLHEEEITPEILGIVIEIHDWKNSFDVWTDETTHFQKKWIEKFGRRIDVLWASGSLTKSFAESSLRVVDESG